MCSATGAGSAIRCTVSRASAGGSVVRSAPGSISVSSTAASSRSCSSVRATFASAAGCRARISRIRPRVVVALVASSRHGSPRASQYAAVSARVSPSSGRITRPDRAGIPSSARRPGEATSR